HTRSDRDWSSDVCSSDLLLLLDEPMAGLSSGESDAMQLILSRLDPAISVLLIEHDMDIAFGFADRITVLYQGSVLAAGLKDEIKIGRASCREGVEKESGE